MPLEVIGAGLGRTGTMSLKVALEQLGLGPCYHMIEVLSEPARSEQWLRAAAGELEWDRVFEGYAATVDYPGCVFWRELADYFPHAKVVLTVRDPDRWFDSTQATIFSPAHVQRLAGSPMQAFFRTAVVRDYGDRLHDRAFMTALFRRHVAEVTSAVPRDRLLVYEVGEGWAPLCEFLGVPVPEAVFPRVNSRAEFAARSVVAGEGAREGALDMETVSRQARARLAALRAEKGSEPFFEKGL